MVEWNTARFTAASVLASCVVSVAVVLGCDPSRDEPPRQVALEDAQEVLEAEYCALLFSCGCQGMTFETLDACGDYVRSSLEELQQPPPGLEDLAYDPVCMGEKVDAIAARGCSPATDDDDACERPCLLYHGEIDVGEPCRAAMDTVDSYSECSQGLRCDVTECTSHDMCTGTCVDPCVDSGFTTSGGDDDDCDPTGGSCMPSPDGAADDEPCTGHAQCQSGYCPAGFCAPLPEAGESCAGTFACAEGLTCDSATRRCVTPDAHVCTDRPALH